MSIIPCSVTVTAIVTRLLPRCLSLELARCSCHSRSVGLPRRASPVEIAESRSRSSATSLCEPAVAHFLQRFDGCKGHYRKVPLLTYRQRLSAQPSRAAV